MASKCNCDSINIVDIPVPKTIKVVKDLTPSEDAGLFVLELNAVVEFTDAASLVGARALEQGFATVEAVHGRELDALLKRKGAAQLRRYSSPRCRGVSHVEAVPRGRSSRESHQCRSRTARAEQAHR